MSQRSRVERTLFPAWYTKPFALLRMGKTKIRLLLEANRHGGSVPEEAKTKSQNR
ncbi:MAG: hypothetical protein AB8G18_04730 [Gammaproteobacteria bacterium]